MFYRQLNAICATLVLCLMLALSTQPPIRLHVIANSDSAFDQATKLEVRDAIIAVMNRAPIENRSQALEAVMSHGAQLQSTAEGVLNAKGAAYGVSLALGYRRFPQRTYADRTYPEGQYQALCVTLGDGGGQNWWCVLYPPLCLGSLEEVDQVEFESLFYELFLKLKAKLLGENS